MFISSASIDGARRPLRTAPSLRVHSVIISIDLQGPKSSAWPLIQVSKLQNMYSDFLSCISLVIVGGLSGLLFTCIVMVASYITTFFMSAFENTTTYNSFFYISPIDVAQDLITAAFRIIRDGDISDFFTEPIVRSQQSPLNTAPLSTPPPGLIKSFIRRFLIGLPLIGAGSIVHMLLSFQMLAPVQFIARYRANRNRRNNSRDFAALIVIVLVVVGALRYILFRPHLVSFAC